MLVLKRTSIPEKIVKLEKKVMGSIGLKAGLTETRMEIENLIEDYELRTKHLNICEKKGLK